MRVDATQFLRRPEHVGCRGGVVQNACAMRGVPVIEMGQWLHVALCMEHAAGYILHVARCLVHVARCMGRIRERVPVVNVLIYAAGLKVRYTMRDHLSGKGLAAGVDRRSTLSAIFGLRAGEW